MKKKLMIGGGDVLEGESEEVGERREEGGGKK